MRKEEEKKTVLEPGIYSVKTTKEATELTRISPKGDDNFNYSGLFYDEADLMFS